MATHIHSGRTRSRLQPTSFQGTTGSKLYVPAIAIVNSESNLNQGIFAQAVRGSIKISSSLVFVDIAKNDPTCFVAPVTVLPGSIVPLTTLGACYCIEFVAGGEVYLWGI